MLGAAATATAKAELAEQLQWALDHRVLIEQAKGVLMEREGCRRRRPLSGCAPLPARWGARSESRPMSF